MSIRDEIDHCQKSRFYEVFQAFRCLESLFFCSTVTTSKPPTSVGLEFFCCNQPESLTFLSEVFIQILCRSQEIDLNLIALVFAKESFYGKYNIHMIREAFDIPRGTFYIILDHGVTILLDHNNPDASIPN